MREIHVTDKFSVKGYIYQFNVDHAITLLDADEPKIDLEPYVKSYRRFDFADLADHRYPNAPQPHHCKDIIDHFMAIPKDESVVVHCHAGISRSTASALAFLFIDHPDWSDDAFQLELIRIRKIALPNVLMAKYYDNILRLEGRMEKLVHKIHFEQRETLNGVLFF